MIVVTGANGKLGQLVVEKLVQKNGPAGIVAAVRDPVKAENIKQLGVAVRRADYDKPETLKEAFKDATRILLISSSEVGKRSAQHRAVIEAAKAAGVKQIAYTSILRADRSSLGLAREHLETERLIEASGLPYTFLRNGWYIENHTENLGSALEHGALMGAAANGKFSSATRADFAQAAANVMTPGHENKIYELGGEHPFSLAELAALVSKRSGKNVVYKDMPAAEYEKLLASFGVPAVFANLLADSDAGAARGDLFTESRDLARLIGKSTTTMDEALSRLFKS